MADEENKEENKKKYQIKVGLFTALFGGLLSIAIIPLVAGFTQYKTSGNTGIAAMVLGVALALFLGYKIARQAAAYKPPPAQPGTPQSPGYTVWTVLKIVLFVILGLAAGLFFIFISCLALIR